MQWFGEPWPSAEFRASVCEDDSDRVPTPADESCPFCSGPIEADDRGVVVPSMEPSGNVFVVENRYIHLNCMLMGVGL